MSEGEEEDAALDSLSLIDLSLEKFEDNLLAPQIDKFVSFPPRTKRKTSFFLSFFRQAERLKRIHLGERTGKINNRQERKKQRTHPYRRTEKERFFPPPPPPPEAKKKERCPSNMSFLSTNSFPLLFQCFFFFF